MNEPQTGGTVVTEPPTERRRGALPSWMRHAIVAILGMLVALGTCYLLRKLGY